MQVYDISTLLDHFPSTILPKKSKKKKSVGVSSHTLLGKYVDGGMKRKYKHQMHDAKA
jgi:hypothetical protein